MRRLAAGQVQALRELKALWPETRFTLIGATALACQLREFYRQTYDLDVSVALPLDQLPSELRKLPGWQRHARNEHEWRTPDGTRVDVIPAGPALLAAGSLVWPESGSPMRLLGFRHAFERVRPLVLADDFAVNVATIPVIALLKIIAYQDRPFDRERDLGDIAFILDRYPADEDPRRFADEVMAAGVTYEEANGLILGRELAELTDAAEKAATQLFIRCVLDETDGGRTRGVLLHQSPAGWRNRPEELLSRVRALERGLRG